MANDPNNAATGNLNSKNYPFSPWQSLLLRLLCIILLGILVGQILSYSAKTVQPKAQPAGFADGMLHGAMMPCTLPAHLIGHEVEIYAVKNTGRGYKLGYTLGVNLCGAVFFGVLYYRFTHWRSRRSHKLPSAPPSADKT
jgi:hypothetical protein